MMSYIKWLKVKVEPSQYDINQIIMMSYIKKLMEKDSKSKSICVWTKTKSEITISTLSSFSFRDNSEIKSLCNEINYYSN